MRTHQRRQDRVKTGISGLDELVEGGLIPNSSILLRGEAGSGKTIFGLHFLKQGAMNKEPGVLLSLEEERKDILNEGARFGWDLEALERQDKLAIINQQAQYSLTISLLYETIQRLGATRVVIDSVPALFTSFPNELRRSLWRASFRLLCQPLMDAYNCTSILISETQWSKEHGFEEYVTKGVIELESKVMDGVIRKFLLVKKMREVRHSRRLHLYEITNNGFTIFTPTVERTEENRNVQPST
jgi:KaiC/GvpD/RAD55 family RecA-like ATPase